MTNYERLKSMAIEELAKDDNILSCYCCIFNGLPCSSSDCDKGRKAWLDKEFEG